MKLSQRSLNSLKGVHPDLVRVIAETQVIPGCRLEIVEGLRDMATQEKYLRTGASKTLNSRHLTGHAADFAMYRDIDGDGDLDFIKVVDPDYRAQAKLFKETAKRLGVDMEWGGEIWPNHIDGMHLQLSWASYPLQQKPKTVSNSKTIAASISGMGITVLPEIVAKASEMTGSVASFVKEEWLVYIQIALTVCLFAFVANERRNLNRREGV
jgi:peptidoglycan L-alanyl-D-glutamate endopeptidase CwlK